MNNVLKKVLSMVLSMVMAFSSLTVMGVTSVSAAEGDVTVYACEGVQEAAYIEWAAVSGTDHYYVSYAPAGSSSFTQIDDELIRQYPDRWRADLIGLAAGNYTVRVTCKDAGGSTIAEATAQCGVVAQDRTGFTFSPESLRYDNGGCGAYNGDGTLKAGANVLYITDDNFDTVTLTLKDKNNENYTATGLAEICKTMGEAAQKGYSNPPLAIRFLGTIGENHNDLASPQILETKAKDNAVVNITFEGVGEDTIFDGLGLRLNGVANCEIRNIAFYNWHDDAIQLQGQENSNHWIHNNDLFYGEDHGGDQEKGDGATDIKDDSKYVTYSYNHYWDSGKTSLCGMKGETGDNYISYHHNWFDHSDSRHPRIRTMFVHVYNNYYDGNSKYGVGAAQNSSAFVEGNYFRNCKYPMLTSMQGSDIAADGTGTFSKENGGVIKAYNNYIEGGQGVVYYNASTAPVEYDAYLASSRDEAVPSSVKAKQGGKTFNNSNVDAYVLSIPVEDPATARDKAVKYAGRTGDDFLFTFNNAVDDDDYDINTALASAVQAYARNTADDFVSYGGASDGSGPVETTETTTEATTEAPTETTTETITEETTFSDPVEVSEAETGFVSDNPSDTGAGVEVVYDEETDRWMLKDTSETAAAELTIPFAEQTRGKIVISGSAEPSVTGSKWMFVQIRGTKADGTSGEIIAFGGGANKEDLSVRVNGASTYNKIGTLTDKNYNYTLIIDLDNKTADVTIDGIKASYSLDVASINSLYSTTSKTGRRNVTIGVPYVGVLTDDVPPVTDTTTESTTATETTTVTETTTEATTVTETTTEVTTVTETSSETTTENIPDPEPGVVYGDVDDNGKLEVNDASVLIDMILKGSVEAVSGVTDVTMDGKVNTADVAAILQKVLDSSWNMPCEPDEEPTETTTEEPTESTTEEPTEAPTEEPTEAPTETTTEATTPVEPGAAVDTFIADNLTVSEISADTYVENNKFLVLAETSVTQENGTAATGTVSVDGNKKTFPSGNSYTQRFKFGGAAITAAGETLPTARAIVFEATGAGTLTVDMLSSSSTSVRQLDLVNAATGEVVATLAAYGSIDAVPGVQVMTIPEAGVYYLTSNKEIGGGINIYGLYSDVALAENPELPSGSVVEPTDSTTEAPTETTTEETTEAPTEEPTEAPTETTEAPTESTTEAPAGEDVFYNFDDSPVITKDGTEGIVYTVTNKGTSDGLAAEAVIADNGGSPALYLNDKSETDTVKATLPLNEKNSGVATYTFKVTPSTASGSWTLAQLNGVKADDTEGEVVGLRTDGSKNYGLRINGGDAVTASSVAIGAGTTATIVIAVDFDNDTATLSVNGSPSVTATGVDAKSITSLSFQTASGARELYVDDAGIIENGTMPPEESTEEPTEGTTSEPVPTPEGSYVHNFTSDGTTSSFFTISGNLSTSKGTVNYNGMTLTQCLKLETATSIKFTAPSAGKLTMVFNSADSKKNCKIDGERYDADASGILTVDLAAGAHEITKRDSSNLFYMVFTPEA